ncbi:MAG: glycoside hydrolase family 16 protein [Bacteroidales bacterium]|nr:glycoside hydrolase family 16 protein [Bacteroidales bacterium]
MRLIHCDKIGFPLAIALFSLMVSAYGQSKERTDPNNIPQYKGYTLVWYDEFEEEGRPGKDWSYETGFVRNEELQYYQADNATVHDGVLDIEGRVERVMNKKYYPQVDNWRHNRRYADYSSASLTTQGSHAFRYGRFEIRAKIPTASGSWPAIWLLGNKHEWPECGEIDIMEYYIKYGAPGILANACWGGTKRYNGQWDEGYVPVSHFTKKDPQWTEKFHTWRLDWTPKYLKIYVDGELLNTIELRKTRNMGWQGNRMNPFKSDEEDFGLYLILNLALGRNGGTPDNKLYPIHYLVDFVRVYQPARASYECRHICK